MTANRVLIIAEAGVNHDGSLEKAIELVDIAAKAGADAIKFQTWITEDIATQDAPKAAYQVQNDGAQNSQYEMLKRLELSYADFRKVKKICDDKKIIFLSTPDEKKSLDFLVDELGMSMIKIGSGEITNIGFLRDVGRKNRTVILSTGMSTLEEVERAVHELRSSGAKDIRVLHCTSAYPASFEHLNLKAMITMKSALNLPIGYSDHSLGTEVSVAAVALGAQIIEKHFTYDSNAKGPDHAASLDPDELKSLVKQIRNIELALQGDGLKKPQPGEMETRLVTRKGLYAKRAFEKGDAITLEGLNYMRPIGHISCEHLDNVVGKRAKSRIEKGQSLNWSDLE